MWGVSVIVGVLALVGAVLIIWPGRMKWPRVAAALALTGAAGIIGGSLGPPLHKGVTWLDGKACDAIAKLVGTHSAAGKPITPGTAFAGIIGVFFVGVWAWWIYHKQIDLKTLGLSLAIPLLVTLIPGVVGDVAIFVIGLVPQLVSGLLGLLYSGSWGG